MEGYFKIATDDNKFEELGMIQSNKWQNNIPKAAEALILLNLIKNIADNAKHLTEGSIIIFYNNRKVIQAINKGFCKALEGTQDRALLISEIIEILNIATIEIYLEFQEGHPKIKQDETFKSHPGKYLIKDCNNKAKAIKYQYTKFK